MSEEREERKGGGGALWDRRVKGAGSGRQRRIRTLNTYQKRKEEKKIGNKFTWQHFCSYASMLPDWRKGFEIGSLISSCLSVSFLTHIVNPHTVAQFSTRSAER